MTPDVRNLLAGYATGTLTPEERERLFTAALDDSELFEMLAGEEALREALEDPASRAELLARIEPSSTPAWYRFAEWLRRPRIAAALATFAVVSGVVSIIPLVRRTPAPPTVTVAQTVRSTTPEPARVPAEQTSPPAASTATVTAPRMKALSRNNVPPPPPAQAGPKAQPGLAPEAAAPAAPPPQPAEEKPVAVADSAAPVAQALTVAREEKLAATANAPLTYALLQRSANGTWYPVDRSTQFATGDVVRVRVEPPRPVMLSRTAQAPPAALHRAGPGEPFEFDVTIGPGDHREEIRVINTPASRALLTGGGFRAPSADKVAAPPAPVTSLEIVIHHKNF